jgi:hypothetical protein
VCIIAVFIDTRMDAMSPLASDQNSRELRPQNEVQMAEISSEKRSNKLRPTIKFCKYAMIVAIGPIPLHVLLPSGRFRDQVFDQ